MEWNEKVSIGNCLEPNKIPSNPHHQKHSIAENNDVVFFFINNQKI